MNTTETAILNAAEQISPNAPIVQAAEAVAATVADPSPETIVNDLITAHTLVAEFKAAMANLHPTVANFFKAIF